jgi:hypothetical protein
VNYDHEEAELEEARRRRRPEGGEEEQEKLMNVEEEEKEINSMNVAPLPQTAAQEPVLVRHVEKNGRTKIKKPLRIPVVFILRQNNKQK